MQIMKPQTSGDARHRAQGKSIYKFEPVAIFFFIVSSLEYWHGLLTLPTHVSMSIHISTYVVGIHLHITSTDAYYHNF